MPTEKEVLRINGHEVTVTNPRKVYFPETGHTKLDLVQYYLAVADGALRGAGGRPMALKRFVDGAAGQAFFQKRAPENLPPFIRTATLTFPSGRTADEIVIDDAAGLAWVANLGCIDLNPHPVRAEDLDHPDELRVDLDPVPGVEWPQIRLRGARRARVARGRRARSAGRRRPARAGSTSTSGSSRAGPSRRSAARPWPWPATWSAASRTSPPRKWWKEERHGVFLDYNQNAKDRTVASAYSVRPLPDARVSTPLTWDEVPTVEAEAFTIDTVPARFAVDRRPGGRDRRGRRLAGGAAGAERARRGGGARRRAVATELRETGRRAATRPAVTGAPAEVRVRAGAWRGWRPAAGGRRGARRGGRGR